MKRWASASCADACLCGAQDAQVRWTMPPWRIVACTACGLLRTDPRPTDEALALAYADDPAHQASPPAHHGSGWRRIWLLPPLPYGSRVLELGAASGRFARWAERHRGWYVTELDGVGVAETVTLAPGSFDAVVGWQVLEHTLDPCRVLAQAYRALRPSGWLALSVPNVASAERWIFRTRWPDWDLPRHLWHFTARTLTRLVQASGFRVVRLAHQRGCHGVSPRSVADLLGVLVAATRCSARITLLAQRP